MSKSRQEGAKQRQALVAFCTLLLLLYLFPFLSHKSPRLFSFIFSISRPTSVCPPSRCFVPLLSFQSVVSSCPPTTDREMGVAEPDFTTHHPQDRQWKGG